MPGSGIRRMRSSCGTTRQATENGPRKTRDRRGDGHRDRSAPRRGRLVVRRGEVWWAELPDPAGRRPVILLSRNEAYAVRELVTVAPVTSRRRGIPSEVPLDRTDGLPRACAASLDTITTIPKQILTRRIAQLEPPKVVAIDRAPALRSASCRRPPPASLPPHHAPVKTCPFPCRRSTSRRTAAR